MKKYKQSIIIITSFFMLLIIALCLKQYIPEGKYDKDVNKLLSELSNLTHVFYKSGFIKNKKIENLIEKADRSGLSNFERVKFAKAVLSDNSRPEDNNSQLEDDLSEELNNFIWLAGKRKSIRSFSNEKVPSHIIRKILECAIQAPSSCNRQTWRFLIVEEKDDLKFIADWRPESFMQKAPLAICIFVDTNLYSPDEQKTMQLDGGAAIMNIIHAAESLGLNSCWVNVKDDPGHIKEFMDYFKLEDNFLPISFVALGYGNQSIAKPAREGAEFYILNK